MSMGVSPPPFHGGFSAQPWHHDPSRGGPGGLGQGAHLLGRGPREGGVRKAFPSLLLCAISGGARQSWCVPGLERRTGLSLRPFSAAEGRTDARSGRGVEGRAEVSPFASPLLVG